MSVVPPVISISIVSHYHASLLNVLLEDIEKYCQDYPLEILLTLNVPELLLFDVEDFSFPILVHKNTAPQGFGANHNHAFLRSSGQFFCVMNPDIRLNEGVFPVMSSYLKDTSVGVVAPIVVNTHGELEDSARFFPTPFRILCKVFGGCKGGDYVVADVAIFPDWVGGMFMLFPRTVFQKLDGFDERYFLYYEDVDLCARLRLQKYAVVLCPEVQVVHHARRSSHRSLTFLRWHLSSMFRFFFSMPFLKIFWSRLIGSSS